MPQVNSYTEATTLASGDWLYLDKSDGAGGYLPRKVNADKLLLASGNQTFTGTLSMLGTISNAAYLLNHTGATEQRGLRVGSGNTYSWASSSSSVGSPDLFLLRDAANVLAQRNGTSAQTKRLYGTFTDASNYERLAFVTQTGNHQITPQAAGTGTLRNLQLGDSGVDTIIAVGTSAPADGELSASQFAAWVDESGNTLTFKVKYADGTTVKSGTVALT